MTSRPIIIDFHLREPHESRRAAETWCRANMVSVGEVQPGAPRGLLYGKYHIPAWRMLSPEQRQAMHGTMTGDMVTGPVVVSIAPRQEV